MNYPFKEIEKKWQKFWEENNCFKAEVDETKKKFYALVEFPYPSANGLHVGHPRSYVALDIVARKRRMEGYNVLYPMGWDSFGLPTENFAIKNHVHPETITKKNIEKFKAQLKSLGLSFDWSREVATTDPAYYKWTQWIFVQLFKKGLAYKKDMAVNWCTGCKCVLANEEVINGKCERCGSEAIQKNKSQWMLKITDYAEKLLSGLDDVDFIKPVKIQQRNWIGRSFGAVINFKTTSDSEFSIYSSRPETVFGVSFMAVCPEHEIIRKESSKIKNLEEILEYEKEAAKKSEFEKSKLQKQKTGVKIEGIEAINPVNNEKIPIYVADYVLGSYGSGAIMGVAAHDERDFEFAKIFNIRIVKVLNDDEDETLINSDFLNGLSAKEAKMKIIEWLEENGVGKSQVNYKLRDWIFARQRYWGEPIPIINCPNCNQVAVDESSLPLELPKIDNFEPTDDGESVLSKIPEFVNTVCPKCGAKAKRETDTMPQWAGSSWYFLRYCSPNCDTNLAEEKDLNYWMPVDWYNGGMEHTTLHLLYSRFWHKFLYDIGVVKTEEPYSKRTSHGMILGQNGEKMSKSRGNVVNPDEVVEQSGADTLRLYEMFMGDFEKAAPWNTSSIKGCERFLEKVWSLQEICVEGEIREEFKDLINSTIKKVSEDIEKMKFNTAISALMSCLNEISPTKKITSKELEIVLLLLNPFAPHITEEINSALKLGDFCVNKSWPKFSECTPCGSVEIVVQICGKIKAKLSVPFNLDEQEAVNLAKDNEKIKDILSNKQTVKTIYVKNKLVNFVVK